MNSNYSWLNPAYDPDPDTQLDDDTDSPTTSASPDCFIGDEMTPIPQPSTTRIYFVNVNGLSYGATGGEFSEVCATMATDNIDILGLAETKLDTYHRKVLSTCYKAARQNLTHSKVLLSSSRRVYGSPNKPGGTGLITAGSLVGRLHNTGTDEMGRWCYATYKGTNDTLLTVITAYQVCHTTPTYDLSRQPSSNNNTTIKKWAAVTQQFSMMQEADPYNTRHPREQFRYDLLQFLRQLQHQRHDILLMGDFNEALGSEPSGMYHIAGVCALVDLLRLKIGTTDFNTYVGGSERIDYVLASPRLVSACTSCGYEPVKFRFPGDHRGIFMDFDTNSLFGNSTVPLPPPHSRHIHSRHETNRERYVCAKHAYLLNHQWFERLDALISAPSPNPVAAERLDKDWVRASLHAERQCSRPPNVPFFTELAKARNRKNALQIIISSTRWRIPMDEARARATTRCTDPLPDTLDQCQREYKQLKRKIRQLESQAVTLRRQDQESAYQALLLAGEKAGAKAIRNIMHAEELKEMWRQLHSLEFKEDAGISSIEIPADGNLDSSHCKQCNEWITLDDSKEIEAALRSRNQQHFGQAHGTPPTVSPLRERINWEASTYESELILEGDTPPDDQLDEIQQLMLSHFQRTTDLDKITAELTEEEWIGKMKIWNEATTTSPSGLHLGHHKALIKPFPMPENSRDDDLDSPPPTEILRCALLQAQIQLINYAIHHSHCFERWSKVANFMLQKEPGNRKIHRLRVIHLYEADFNLLLGVKWRQLTHHCIDNHLLNPWQFGGLPGRDAMTPVFLEELQWEITRISCRPLLRMDFDATSCYDRIIPNLASLVARSFGQHRLLVAIHAKFLKQAKYLLKTKLGLSNEHYSDSELHPIYGTGQGSANSPVIWVLISSRLFDAHASKAQGASFSSPDRTVHTPVHMIGFVDDSNNCVNDFAQSNVPVQEILTQAQHDAQLWNDLLHCSGGALEVRKCMFHFAHFTSTCTGEPVLNHFNPDSMKIQVTEPGPAGETLPIQYLPPTTSRKTLGCWKSPSGTYKQGLAAITKNATKKATLIANSNLDAKSAARYYHSIFLPSVTYPLPTYCIPEKKLVDLQNQTVRPFLSRLGYARSMPRTVIFGPIKLGGADFKPLYDEQESRKLELLIKHLRCPSAVSDHLNIALHWIHRLSGTSFNILQEVTPSLPHVTTPFFSSVRQYLQETSASLEFETTFQVPLQRQGDAHIMDLVLNSGAFNSKQIRYINRCRLYLQVHTISDISNAQGTHMDLSFYHGDPTLVSSNSLDLEILQPKPTAKISWDVWRRACRLWCNSNTGKLHNPLGQWLKYSPHLRRSWPYHFDLVTKTLIVRGQTGYTGHLFNRRRNNFQGHPIARLQTLPENCYPVDCQETLHGYRLCRRHTPPPCPPSTSTPNPTSFESYCASQPLWTRQLLPHLSVFCTPASFLCFAADPDEHLVACSDGSVLNNQGTFGWTFCQANNIQIATCRGPAFGTPMNSYRSECYGILSFTTFLVLMQQFIKAPISDVTLYCDNKAAVKIIAKLRNLPHPTFPNDTLRPSWDILQAIITNISQLENFQLLHVKGHQDDDDSLDDLPLEALLNIQADELAEQFQLESNHKDDSTPMIPGTKCSLKLGGQTLGSNLRKIIRDQRRTERHKQYIQTKFNIPPAAMKDIDWDSHGQAISSFQGGSHKFLVKFLHQWLPVGKVVSRYDPVKYPAKCPSCDAPVEDFQHLFTCPATNRTTWYSALKRDLRARCDKLQTDPALVDLLLYGLENHFKGIPIPTAPALIPPRLRSLCEAQEAIGWDQLQLGRFSCKWRDFQLQYLTRNNIPRTNTNHGTTWTSLIIQVIWEHSQKEWKNRNDDRHGKEESIRTQIRIERAKRETEALYRLRNQCMAHGQTHFFYTSLELHFAKETTAWALEAWLSSYAPLIQKQVRLRQDLLRQQMIPIDDIYHPAQ